MKLSSMLRIALFAVSLMAIFSLSFGWSMGVRPHIKAIFNLRFQVSAATGVPVSILWDYDYSQPLNKPCTTAVTTNCVSGFGVTVLTGTTVTGALQTFTVPATQTAVLTTGISVPYNGPTGLGSYQIQVQTMYKDSSGTVQGGPVSAGPLALTPSAAINPRAQ